MSEEQVTEATIDRWRDGASDGRWTVQIDRAVAIMRTLLSERDAARGILTHLQMSMPLSGPTHATFNDLPAKIAWMVSRWVEAERGRDALKAEVKLLRADQADWRKGVDLIRGSLVQFAKKNLPTLSPVDINRAVLEVLAENERFATLQQTQQEKSDG